MFTNLNTTTFKKKKRKRLQLADEKYSAKQYIVGQARASCVGYVSVVHRQHKQFRYVYTVKPPNIGDGPFVPCREVVVFSEVSFKPIENVFKTKKKHLKFLNVLS